MQPHSNLHHITFDADKSEILQPYSELLASVKGTQTIKNIVDD